MLLGRELQSIVNGGTGRLPRRELRGYNRLHADAGAPRDQVAVSGGRFEDDRLVTGAGRFVADLVPTDALHCSFVRSPVAAGDLLGVDLAAAREAPGVVAAFAATDLSIPHMPADDAPGRDRPVLARDRVRFAGEAVAVVVAGSAVEAEDAAGLAWVDVEPQPAAVSMWDALADPANVVSTDAFAAGPEPEGPELVDVTVAVDHPRLAAAPIEPLAILAVPDGGALRVWVGHQSPHRLRGELAVLLGLDERAVRVTVPDVGGSFGQKRFFPEYAAVAKAALLLGRPVAWVQTRRELFLGGTQGRGQHHEVTLSADAEGRIRRARFRLTTDLGAYPHTGALIPALSRLVATGLYDIPRVEYQRAAVATNLPPTAAYRGAGRPEAALAIERAVDALARRLGLDPAEVRRRNFVKAFPHRTPTGAVLDSGDYRAALDRALELAGYDEVRREQAVRRERDGPPLGIGIGAFVERAGGTTDSSEYGSVELTVAGRLVVRTGSTSAGQGHETVWRRVAAEVFGVGPSLVDLHAGDTAEVPESTGSFASRSAQIGAAAILRCAEAVLDSAVRVAAELLEADPADVVAEPGGFGVAGVPGSRVTLAEVAAAAGGLRREETYSPGAQTFPYGVHVAVVEVDVETGVVTPLRLVAVDDVGEVLDEAIVAGQLHGSVLQGLAAALVEEMRYDGDGQPLTTTLVDYPVPTAVSLPHLDHDRLVHPAPSNPLGVKGAGEGGCIGMPPAVVNATIDALAPYGVTDLQIPLTPGRVWQAIQDARR